MNNVDQEEIILNLIRNSVGKKGTIYEEKVLKMAQLLNIHPDKYEKIKSRLIETGKISKSGEDLKLIS